MNEKSVIYLHCVKTYLELKLVKIHKSTILVLGSNGLVGSAVVRLFFKRQFMNVLTPKRSELDLCCAQAVEKYFAANKPDVVILAAGKVGGINANLASPYDFLNKNLQMQLNVVNASIKHSVTKTVLLGSSCMYPKNSPQPMGVEQLFCGKLEETSLPYAVSKLAGIYLGLTYNAQHNSNNFLCIIPNSVYGPRDNFDPDSAHVMAALISKFHRAKISNQDELELLGTGEPRREFLYSDDLASALLILIEKDVATIDCPINIGQGSDISVRELSQLIAGVVGYKGSVKWNSSYPDGAKQKLLQSDAISALGWSPQTNLIDGVKKTYNWYRSTFT